MMPCALERLVARPQAIHRGHQLVERGVQNSRPSRFFVVPGSSRMTPAVRSIWCHSSGRISLLMRQPV